MSVAPRILALDQDLLQRMQSLGIREEDLEESFIRSGGHGGQNVNKTSTCVQLLHRPSGLQVKCQTARTQYRNRVLARELLADKFQAQQRRQAAAELAAKEKLKRQKRKRTRAAKERMLAAKSKRSEKKNRRRPVQLD